MSFGSGPTPPRLLDLGKMNTLSIILLISTTFSLITSLIGPLSNLVKVITSIPQKIGLLRDEVTTMGNILGECLSTIERNPTRVPAHIQDLGIATYEQWKEVDELAEKTLEATAPDMRSGLWRSLLRIQRVRWIVKREGELSGQVANLRGRVGLLRDSCSEIRVRSQLVEMSAVLSRLNEIPGTKSWPGEHSIVNGVVELEQGDQETTTGSQGVLLTEDQTKVRGQRFGYHPARIKVDSSAAAHFISLEYLQRVGLDLSKHLREIPDREQRQVEGLNGVLYTPRHTIDLRWYQVGELQMNATSFFVVSSAATSSPGFDLLLSTQRFVEAEERQHGASASSYGRNRTAAELAESDYQSAKKRRVAANGVDGNFDRTPISKLQPSTSGREDDGLTNKRRSRDRDLEMGDMGEATWSLGSGQHLVNSGSSSSWVERRG